MPQKKRTMKKVFKYIPEKKSRLESQETDGWTMLNMI
jgi:hypothetical protein